MSQKNSVARILLVAGTMLASASCSSTRSAIPTPAAPSSSFQPSPSSLRPSSLLSSIPAVAALPSSSTITPTVSLSASQPSTTYQVIDELQKNRFTVQPSQIFSPSTLPTAAVNFDAQKLLTVLVNTKAYFQKNLAKDPTITRAGILASQGVTVADTFKTLDFMIQILQADIQAGRSPRLQDAKFIQENFRVIKWRSFNPQAPRQQKVRITKYAVFTHPGSRRKTPIHNTALYSLKSDRPAFDYRKYTKQQVLAGVYNTQGREREEVEPIAYLTRDGLEDALMEGTVLIKFTDSSQGLFNVDRSNEIPYIPGLERRNQKRYWYFKRVEKIKGYGYKGFKIDEKISIEPGVTFAGDVLNIGLGKVVAIEDRSDQSKQLRLGVIADTGGAFLPNLYQLDFLTGFFDNSEQFRSYSHQLPEWTTAYFLIKK